MHNKGVTIEIQSAGTHGERTIDLYIVFQSQIVFEDRIAHGKGICFYNCKHFLIRSFIYRV